MKQNKTRRVALLLPALDMSGAAFAALNILPEMLAKGLTPLVVALAGGEREAMFRELNCQVLVLPRLGQAILGRRALEEVRKFSPGLVHVLAGSMAGVGGKVAKALAAPLVVTVNRLSGVDFTALAKAQPAAIIGLSEDINEKLVNRYDVPRDLVRVIPHGLNLRYFPSPFADNTHGNEPLGRQLPLLGTYGTLLEAKGQRDFLRAGAAVIKSGIDAELMIIGHGPDKPELRRLAAELGVSRQLTFSTSTISDSTNLGGFSVYVEPSRQEGFGMSVLQAMATGVPIVACGVGGIFSLIEHEVDGLLVPAGDIAAISDAATRLLHEPDFALELAHNARRRVESSFCAKKTAPQLLALYDKLLGIERSSDSSSQA